MMEQTILIQLFMKNISIAQLNDAFRRGDPKIPGKFVMTVGIQSFPKGDVQAIIKTVQEFNTFNEDNDPYGEHDLGSFTFKGEKIFWKIDLYDPGLQFYSEDPLVLTKTVRVLTVMKTSEYLPKAPVSGSRFFCCPN